MGRRSASFARSHRREAYRTGALTESQVRRLLGLESRFQLRVTGTLGVLRAGAEQGLVNVPDLLERLEATSFYLDETLLSAVFDRWLKP